jgi:dipeptidase E
MRLFLSSNRFGAYPDRLVKLFGEVEGIAVITNAKDYKTKPERGESVGEVLDFLTNLNYKPVEIDLRKYFEKPYELKKEIDKYSNIWMAGGNTFVLRKALSYSGGDKILINKIKKGELTYGGESAGAVLVTPGFRGVGLVDDPTIIPKSYKAKVIQEGLGLTDYYIVPHYKSAMTGIEGMIEALEELSLPYKTLTDEQVIIIDGDKEEFLK